MIRLKICVTASSSGNQLVTGVPVVFQGLLPTDLPDPQVDRDLGSLITTAAREIRESCPAVRYFGPFRDRPQRRYKLPGADADSNGDQRRACCKHVG